MPAQMTDTELLAIQTCLEALRPLSEEARSRVITYLTDRLGTENATTNGRKDD